MSESDAPVAALFSVSTQVARKSRFALGETRPTAEGGRVGVGVDNNGNAFLVHEVGRQTEALALGAVATAIAGGAIPVDAIVSAFGEIDGALPALAAAVKAAVEAVEVTATTTGRRRAA